MTIPTDRSYSKDHEWVQPEGGALKIGITDYAQDALGDVVFVKLPEIGAVVAAGNSFAEVESTKSVSDIYSPASGKVIDVNRALETEPELVNSSPYDAGWIATIEYSGDFSSLDLLSPNDYGALIEG